MHGDTRAVRESEQIDLEALAACLRWHLTDGQLPGLRLDTPLHLSIFSGTHAHPTYLVRAGGAELVLRRGTTARANHDLACEYRCLDAIHAFYALAPRPYLHCVDTAVLGAPFSLLERRRGLFVRDGEPMPLNGHPDRRHQVSAAAVAALVALHHVSVDSPAVSALGDPVGFLDRQVREWTGRWRSARTEPMDAMDGVALWLIAHQPPDSLDPTVVHGDFTLGNLLLHPLTAGEVVGVLDWSAATIGDPLMDLGILLAHWTAPGDTPDPVPFTARAGYLTRDALLDTYARLSGRDVTNAAFYEVLALFRSAVLAQERTAHGGVQPGDAVPSPVQRLADHALQLTRTFPNI